MGGGFGGARGGGEREASGGLSFCFWVEWNGFGSDACCRHVFLGFAPKCRLEFYEVE